MKTLNKRRDAALKDQFGEPEGLCGGYPHPLFRHEWICISREKVAEILALCPEVKPENGVWRGVYHGPALNSQREDVPWNEEHLLAEKFGEITSGRLEGLDYFTIEHDDYGSGMQIRVEAELLQAMLEEQAEAQATRERREQEAAQREADSIRKREQAEEKRRQWEAGRAERERLDRELREKRAAEEVARNAAFEAEALNLDWDGQRLTVTEEGMALLKGVSKAALDATLGELSKNIMNPVMRQIAEPGNPSAKDLVDIWRNIMRGAPYLMEAAT